MKIELTKELKVKLLNALQVGTIDPANFPEIAGEQEIFPENYLTLDQLKELGINEINMLKQLVLKHSVFSIRPCDLKNL